MLVVNSHIINFVSLQKFWVHLHQVFDSLKSHVGPILLAGDFNTWHNKRLRHLFKHLDHVYCRGLVVLDAQVHTNINSSDHYPISLSLQTVT